MGHEKPDEHPEGGDGGPSLAMAVTTGPLKREGPYGVSRIVFRMGAKLLEDVANHSTIVVQCCLGHAALGSHPLTEVRQ